jgi:hypothetical protein
MLANKTTRLPSQATKPSYTTHTKLPIYPTKSLPPTNLTSFSHTFKPTYLYYSTCFTLRKKYKLPEVKSDIKEALKLGNVRFARHMLAIALNMIGKSSPGRRSRRSLIKLDPKKFLEDVKKNIGEEAFFELLALDGETTLMFAIDVTGSMGEEIEAAKAIATEISIFERRSKPPKDYILSWFSDPKGKI